VAVKREGSYFRRSGEAQAAATQERQALAAIRRLNRRIERVPVVEHEGYYSFLVGCRTDVVNAGIKERQTA